MKIKGRTFIISGGASGLGRACVEDLCKNGANVAVLDLNEENGQDTVRAVGSSSARFFPCDVTDTDSIAAAVMGAVSWAQETGKPLGGVIPVAGIANPTMLLDRDGEPTPLSAFDLVLSVNLRGTLDLIRQSLPHMTSSPSTSRPEGGDGERGVVIMVSSVAAYDGQRGQTAYAASKGAVASMALPMARELARHGVRVVAIAPGIFESPMSKLMAPKVRKSLEGAVEFPRRLGRAGEFADLVRHVIENVMLNGTVLRLDGGIRLPSKM
ncbi:NAD(P)-binding protein [Sodiomyces alkalinus F11]|uniref:NAD(P)-binding protein n=1 Tax=Sodiomyces alkalinus (strain CBS 110278 / VKM F-3762 / F11) TaxID=1314773 RepID=A0A3N2PYN3_SODAK|nr:NAD(P)-binding protein [Sodiomyces alkalinus F11]ROT39639.1 NAD(P)-binding protein [Sodiomyces alkalinus F11]